MRILTQTLLALFATLPNTYAATLILGDTSGNARGTDAVDIQSTRYQATQVASGSYSVAVGLYNTSSGSGSITIGNSNASIGNDSTTVGRDNGTQGYYNFNFGGSNNLSATTQESIAVGLGNDIVGSGGLAFGYLNVIFDNYH